LIENSGTAFKREPASASPGFLARLKTFAGGLLMRRAFIVASDYAGGTFYCRERTNSTVIERVESGNWNFWIAPDGVW
jgi:hypothetical protein